MNCHFQPYVGSCNYNLSSHHCSDGFEPYYTDYYSKVHQPYSDDICYDEHPGFGQIFSSGTQPYGNDSGYYEHPKFEQEFDGSTQPFIDNPWSAYESPYSCSDNYGQYTSPYSAPYTNPLTHHAQQFNRAYQGPDVRNGDFCMSNMHSTGYCIPDYHEYFGSPVIMDTVRDVSEYRMIRDHRPMDGVGIRGSSAMGNGRYRKGYYKSYGGGGCAMM